MRTILWFLYFWLYLLAVEPWLWKVRALKRQGRTEEHDILAGRIIHNWARRLLAAAGARVTVEGLENLPEGTAVFVSNHQSYFDIPLALGYLGDPKGLVSKKEIDRIPFIRQWMRELGCVFLDRENLRASVAALGDASDRVAAGYSMVVFPEGTRTETGEVGEFKAAIGFLSSYQPGGAEDRPARRTLKSGVLVPGQLRGHASPDGWRPEWPPWRGGPCPPPWPRRPRRDRRPPAGRTPSWRSGRWGRCGRTACTCRGPAPGW